MREAVGNFRTSHFKLSSGVIGMDYRSRWQPLRELGSGGQGTVHLAVDLKKLNIEMQVFAPIQAALVGLHQMGSADEHRAAGGRLLVLLCYKVSSRFRWTTTGATGQSLQQRAGQEFVRRGDGRRHMAFRPHRECPAA